MNQMMAPLPEDRLTPGEAPFTRVGIDYFGPLYTKVGRSTPKRYGVIFTCLACRAVHLEVAHSLDTDSFLGAFSRFTARRGVPKVVISDNGTNLTAAEKELKSMLDQLNQTKIEKRHREMEWKFLPPGASHMAGVWERLIRSTKNILRALINKEDQRCVSDETLHTILCEVEAILNDRPISQNHSSPDDFPALTPNMLLTFTRRPATPPGNFDEKDVYSKRWWRRAQHLADVFWKRWLVEYVPTLQPRSKWTREQPSLEKDDIVLVADENSSRCDWPLGRIMELNRSDDGYIRSAKVRFRGKELIRPISRLCVLEQHH